MRRHKNEHDWKTRKHSYSSALQKIRACRFRLPEHTVSRVGHLASCGLRSTFLLSCWSIWNRDQSSECNTVKSEEFDSLFMKKSTSVIRPAALYQWTMCPVEAGAKIWIRCSKPDHPIKSTRPVVRTKRSLGNVKSYFFAGGRPLFVSFRAQQWPFLQIDVMLRFGEVFIWLGSRSCRLVRDALALFPLELLIKAEKNPDWTSNRKKRFLEDAEKEGEASQRHRSLAGLTLIFGEIKGDLNFSSP